jgi:hypothetical protein
MEPDLVLKTAVVLLAVAALGGMAMAGLRLRGAPHPPASFAMAHGLLAGAALTLLLYAAFTVGIPPLAQAAVAVLLGAALLGTWLNLGFHARLQPIPIRPMIVHALVAVAGFTLLLLVLLVGRAT